MAQMPDEPLTMTVHTLPSPEQACTFDAAKTRSGRWKMLLLFLVAASPVVASYFTYYVIRPEGRRNYGELIDPQRPLPAITGVDVNGQAVDLRSLKDQWLLISVGDSACDAACEKRLFLQRQLRETLGREKERVDWVWLRTGSPEMAPQLSQATAAATVIHVDAQQLAQWLQPAQGHRIDEHLYVVDPVGNWMMRFPADLEPKKVKSDLERLLRASAFWDRPGRGAAAQPGDGN